MPPKAPEGYVTRAEYDAMRRLAYSDCLTGIANRRAFDEMLMHEMERAERKKHPLSLAIMDLDHFKKVNDTYGHLVGDAVLIKLSEILLGMYRYSTDFVARVGGEEFALILPGVAHNDAPTVYIERLRAEIERGLVIKIKEVSFSVTASFGMVEMKRNEMPDKFFARADKALYAAKRSGRNKVVFHAIPAIL